MESSLSTRGMFLSAVRHGHCLARTTGEDDAQSVAAG